MTKRVLPATILASSYLLLSGCASVPKAPTVSAFNRTPVNSPVQIDLQSCKSDLNNTKLLLNETARLADSASAGLSQMAGRCAVTKTATASFIELSPPIGVIRANPTTTTSIVQPSTVYVLRFPFASSTINLTDESAITLSVAARSAQLVVVRGRTDGSKESPAESFVAKARAESVRRYLVAQGIDPDRIRINYQAVGDYVANNSTEAGRVKNRRAEVEVYQIAPVEQTLAQAGL